MLLRSSPNDKFVILWLSRLVAHSSLISAGQAVLALTNWYPTRLASKSKLNLKEMTRIEILKLEVELENGWE